ncbi:hypothetical protein BJX76DRAFT_361314 [Aspergillus varians]
MDSDSEERECTEIDEEGLLSRAADASPVVEGAAAVNYSTLRAPRDTDISSIPDEGAGAVDVDVDMDSSAQNQLKGNCKATERSLATQGQSIAQGGITNLDPSTEQRPGLGSLPPITEHTEQEITQPVDDPDDPDHFSGGPLPAKAREGIAGEQMADGTELIAEAGEELLQQDQVARERADALTRLQTPEIIEDHAPRPVTKIPTNLPSLITRLQEEGGQLDNASVIPDNNRTQELPELEPATVNHPDSVGGGTAAEPTDQAVEKDLERPTLEVPDPLHPRNMREDLSSNVPLEQRVTVTFYVYERQAWRKMDMVTVSPTPIAEAQVIADRYAQDPSQYARFYDG